MPKLGACILADFELHKDGLFVFSKKHNKSNKVCFFTFLFKTMKKF